MISHLLALSAIQCCRWILGLCIGAFLILRSQAIPYDRLDRLEPGDRMFFLVLGCLFILFALLRGIQATLAIRLVFKNRRGGLSEPAPQGFRPFLRFALGLLWMALGAAILGLYLLSGPLQGWLDGSGLKRWPWFMTVLEYPMPMLIVWSGVLVVLLIRFFAPLKGRGLRRLGLALSVVDILDLTGFPFTTGCGTYGLVVYRHPDIKDAMEGIFSR